MISTEALVAALRQREAERGRQRPRHLQENEWSHFKLQEQGKQEENIPALNQPNASYGEQRGGTELCDGAFSTKQSSRNPPGDIEPEQMNGEAYSALLHCYREKFEELQNSCANLRKERASLKEQRAALMKEHRSVEESLQRIAAEVENLKVQSRGTAETSTAFLAHFIATALRSFLETAANGGTLRDVVRRLRGEMEALQMHSGGDPRLLSCYTRLKKVDKRIEEEGEGRRGAGGGGRDAGKRMKKRTLLSEHPVESTVSVQQKNQLFPGQGGGSGSGSSGVEVSLGQQKGSEIQEQKQEQREQRQTTEEDAKQKRQEQTTKLFSDFISDVVTTTIPQQKRQQHDKKDNKGLQQLQHQQQPVERPNKDEEAEDDSQQGQLSSREQQQMQSLQEKQPQQQQKAEEQEEEEEEDEEKQGEETMKQHTSKKDAFSDTGGQSTSGEGFSLQKNSSLPFFDSHTATTCGRRRHTSPHGTKLVSPVHQLSGLPEAARRRSATALGSGSVSLAAQFAVAARAPIPREEHKPMMLPEISQEQETESSVRPLCTWPLPWYPSVTKGRVVSSTYTKSVLGGQSDNNKETREQQGGGGMKQVEEDVGKSHVVDSSSQQQQQQQQRSSSWVLTEALCSSSDMDDDLRAQQQQITASDNKRGSRGDGGGSSVAFPFLTRSHPPAFSINPVNANSATSPSQDVFSPGSSPLASFYLPPVAFSKKNNKQGWSPRDAASAEGAAGAATPGAGGGGGVTEKRRSSPSYSAGTAFQGLRGNAAMEIEHLQQQLAQLQLQLQRLELHVQHQQQEQQPTAGGITCERRGEEDKEEDMTDSVCLATAAGAAGPKRPALSTAGWLSGRPCRRAVAAGDVHQQSVKRKEDPQEDEDAATAEGFSPFLTSAAGGPAGQRLQPSSSGSVYSSTEAFDGSKGVRSLDLDNCSSCSSAAGFGRRRSRGGSNECSPAVAQRNTEQMQGQQEKLFSVNQRRRRQSSDVEGGADVDLLQEQQAQERQQPETLFNSNNWSASGRRESGTSTIPSAFQHLAAQQKQQYQDNNSTHKHHHHHYHRMRSHRSAASQPHLPQQRGNRPQLQEDSHSWSMQMQLPPWQRRQRQQQQQRNFWDYRGDDSEEEAWRWGLIEPSPSRKGQSGSRSISMPSPATVPSSSSYVSAGVLDTGGLLAVCRTILEHERRANSNDIPQPPQQSSSSIIQPITSSCSFPQQQQQQKELSLAVPQKQRGGIAQTCLVVAPEKLRIQAEQGEEAEHADTTDKTRALQEALRLQREALLQQRTTARQLQRALQQQQEALKAAAVGVTGAIPAGVEPERSNGPVARVTDYSLSSSTPEGAAAEIAAFHAKSCQQQLEEVWLRVTQLQAQLLAKSENPQLLQQLMLVPGSSTSEARSSMPDNLRGYAAVPSAPL